ncbi:GNAT family N-acetyltransferase [Georgenia ruanii]|nr:GNAT family N-acetyltransferase [Georgenia ruanii]
MPHTASITVSTVRPEELDRVGELSVAAYRAAGMAEEDDGYALALRDVGRRAAEAIVLVARAGREVLGTLTLAAAGTAYADLAREDELEVRMLAVDPAAQRRGVAEALLRAAQEWAAEQGYPRLVLSVLSVAGPAIPHRLYERVGYRRNPGRDYVGSWDPTAVMWFYELEV